MLTEDLKLELEKQFDETPDYVIGVSYGFKKKNGQKTNQKSIIFKVLNKKPVGQIPQNEIIPPSIKVSGSEYITDVIEGTKAEFFNCFASESDPSIQRLRGIPNLLAPMRGGNELVLLPDGWSGPALGSSDYTVGTLGFFAVDNYDDKVVGVTNSHVAVLHRLFCNERNIEDEIPNPYNTIDERPWTNILPDLDINPKCGVWNNTNLSDASVNIKRYMPVTAIGKNYVDCALLIMNSGNVPATVTPYIDSTSYQVWQPIGEPDYPTHMPFASKQELDNLLISNPNLYSTGRRTGPKGWAPISSCILRVTEVGVNETIGGEEGDTYWSDIIKFQYEDGVGYPARPGDSGSVVIADFSGVRKIVGLLFAGNEAESYGLFCRIDRVATTMNIRAWDASYVLDKSYPTKTEILVTPEANLGGTPNFVENGKNFWQSGFRYSTSAGGQQPEQPPELITGLSWTTSITSGSSCSPPPYWLTSADNKSVSFIIADSSNCGGWCNQKQAGIATAKITVKEYNVKMSIYFDGVGELEQSSYESLKFFLDNTELANAHAAGGGKGCTAFGPIVKNYIVPNGYILSSGTTHDLKIVFDTNDALYHVNCFYKIFFSFQIYNPPPGSMNLSDKSYTLLENKNDKNYDYSSKNYLNISNVASKKKLVPSSSITRTKLCQYASKMPLEVIDSYHGKTAIRRCDIYGFCSHSIKIPDRPEVYSCQECTNYFTNDNIPEELLIFTEKNREETIKVMNINNQQTPDQSLFQEVKYKKIDDFLKKSGKETVEVEYKDLSEVSEQNLKDMNAMKVKPIDNIKPNVDELLGE
jgi:hypothetical protein